MELYLNHYLLYEEPIEARQGVLHVDMFFDYWYPRKVLCASEASLRSIAASLKKFYGFMNAQGLVSDEAMSHLREQIRQDMPEWLAEIRRYR